jgi:hypothetical protein
MPPLRRWDRKRGGGDSCAPAPLLRPRKNRATDIVRGAWWDPKVQPEPLVSVTDEKFSAHPGSRMEWEKPRDGRFALAWPLYTA